MKGCLQGIAGFFAVLLVVTAVLALFTVNFVRTFTDRENFKAALDLEQIFREIGPELLVSEFRSNEFAASLPIDVNVGMVEDAFDLLLPPEWIDEQGDRIVDELFDFLETGNLAEASSVTLDLQPLVQRLRGDVGRQAVSAVLNSLPSCPDPQPVVDLLNGRFEIPNCLPTIVPIEEATNFIHNTIVETIDVNPQLIGSATTVTVPLFNLNQLSQQDLERLFLFQQYYLLAKDWVWLLWLLPLFCLGVVTITAVRSLRDWGQWWGWSLLIGGGLTLLIGLILPALILAQSRLILPNANALIADGTAQLVQSGIANMVEFWLQRVYLQAGSITILGLIFVIIGSLAKK